MSGGLHVPVWTGWLIGALLWVGCGRREQAVPPPVVPPAPATLSLQDCYELVDLAATGPRCQLAPGKDFTVMIEPGALPEVSSSAGVLPEVSSRPARALLALVGPDGGVRRLEGPFDLEGPHLWRGPLEAGEAWSGREASLEALLWTGADPPLPDMAAPGSESGGNVSAVDPAVAAFWKAQAVRPEARHLRVAFTIARPFGSDTLPAGSAASACWQAYLEGDVSDPAVAVCSRAWADPSTLEPIDRLRMGNLLGLLFRQRGELSKAAEVLEAVAGAAVDAGQIKRARVAMHNHADVLLNDGRLDRALEVLARARDLIRRAGDRYGEAALLRKWGEVHQRQGDYSEADERLRAAITAARAIGDTDTGAFSSLSLAILHGQIGDPLTGLSWLEGARAWFESLERNHADSPAHQEDLGKYYGTLGWLRAQAFRRGQRTDRWAAIERETYEKALHYFTTRAPESPEVTDFRLLVADLRRLDGDLEGAEARLEQAVPDRAARRDNPSWLSIHGELQLARGQWGAALATYQRMEALPALEPDVDWNAAYGRARALAGLGKRTAAREALELALARIEATARGIDPWQGRGWYVGEREEVFRYAEGLLLEDGDRAGALRVAERSRVVAAQVAASHARVKWLAVHAPAELARRQSELEALMEQLHVDEAEAVLGPAARRRREQARRQAAEALSARKLELARWIEVSVPIREPAPPDLEAVRSALRPDEALLAYSAAPGALVSYLVTAAGSLETRTLELSPSAAREQVERFRQTLLGEGAGEATAGTTLARTLLEPWIDRLPSRRLIVVPYGALYRLPFQALPVGARPLLERVEVVLAPSIALWLEKRVGTGRGTGGANAGTASKKSDPADGGPTGPDVGARAFRPAAALVIGDPTRDLMSTADEARAVAAMMPGSRLLLGAQASRREVLEALASADLFHFAGHGVADGGSAVGQHLLLADRQRLSGLDLLPRPLELELAVLSGCETGGGTLLGGGDFQGLTSGLLGAGTRSVVATFWPLRQGDAGPVVSAFYRRWLEARLPAGEVLRQTLLEAAAGRLGAASAHPRVWAGFALWGG